MEIKTSIGVQAMLVGLALVTTVLRCWVRLFVEHRRLTLPDYLVWGGWLATMGWFACSAIALNVQVEHPLVEPDLTTDSTLYLKTVFLACYFFDVGLYFPKASLVAFYWWLIPRGLRRLRIAVYIASAYLATAFIATILIDTLIAGNISDNWSIENQLNSTWNSDIALYVNWALNWSTDILLFCLPFFIINCLQLRKRQKIALCGVFSLGLVTIVTSLSRFIVYAATENSVDDASGNLWCTAELATATIVVSLPALKVLIMRGTPANTSNRSNSGYIKSGNGKPVGASLGTPRIHVHDGTLRDDEIELVVQGKGSSISKSSLG